MPPPPSPSPDRLRGVLFGVAIGDALGMPLDGLSHQNVRLYYRGVKGYAADEKRGGAPGTGTDITAGLLACARAVGGGPGALSGPPEDRARAAAVATPLAVLDRPARDAWLEAVAAPGPARAAARVHVDTLARLAATAGPFEAEAFWATLRADTAAAEAGTDGRLGARLEALAGRLALFPLDLQDLCDGTGDAPDEAWPFAAAMFARGPHLIEATLLSAVNVGGAAATVGALVGGLLGALNGASAFPAPWRADLAARAGVESAAAGLGIAGPAR